jgi:hypothetical protein
MLRCAARGNRLLMICRIARFGTNAIQCASAIFATTYVNHLVLLLPAYTELPQIEISFGLIRRPDLRVLAKPVRRHTMAA